MNEVRFTLRLPNDLSPRLEVAADERGISRNAAVIEAVERWLEPEPGPQTLVTFGPSVKSAMGGVPNRDYGMRKGHAIPVPEPETPPGVSAIEKLRRLR